MSRWYFYKSLVRGRGGSICHKYQWPSQKKWRKHFAACKTRQWQRQNSINHFFLLLLTNSRSWNKKRNVMLYQIRRQQKWTSCETIAHHLIVIKCDYLYLINVKTYLHTEKLYRYLFAHTSNWIVIRNINSRPQARGSRIGRPIIKAQSSLSVHNEDLGAVNIRCVYLFI